MRLFGGLDLRVGDWTAPALSSARATTLLGYLALHRDSAVSRQRLAFLLWPDSSEAQARTNLRKTLHTIRHDVPELEPFLTITPQAVLWNSTQRCWIDVEAFDVFVSIVDGPSAGLDDTIAALRSAVDLYRGDLLPECYDDWAVEARERERDRYLLALARLTSLLADRGENAEAAAVGATLVRLDPLRESGYGLLMRVHDAAGDRAAAIRVYHQCVSTLQRELGVDPSPETAALYDALTRREARTDDPSAAHRPGGVELVGRAAEWKTLTDLWRTADSGEARLVVVAGEPGIGKTRLVDDFAVWCGHRGAEVVSARSYATGGELGYGVAISWLRSRHRAGMLETLPDATRAMLHRLLPELPWESQPAEPLDESDQRRRLIEAVSGALVPPDRTVVLVIDDAQWSDTQSVEVIHHLVRRDLPGRVLVVITMGSREPTDDHPLLDVIADLQRIDRATELTLDRLGRADTQALAGALSLDPSDEAGLFEETEGIPLFIVETARAAAEGLARPGTLSPKLRAVIQARLRRCSPLASKVAGVAATIGRAFTADLVRVAAGLDDEGAVSAFDELWRRGIIREHGHDGYDFTHGQLREVAYDSLSPATRRQRHLAVAETLQHQHWHDRAEASGQIAGHYDRAGHASDAIDWYERAAAESTRRHASADTVRLLERARALIPLLPPGDHRSRELAIVAALPTALVGVDGFTSARVEEVQGRVLELSSGLGVEVEPAVLRSLVMSRLCRRDFDEAQTAARHLQMSAERVGDEGLLVESIYMLGVAAFWTAQLTDARRHFDDVVSRFRTGQRAEHVRRFGHDPVVICLARLGNTLWFLGEPDEAAQARDEALALAAESGHPYSRANAYAFASLLSIDLEEPDRVRTYVGGLQREEHLTRPTAAFAEVLAGFVEIHDGQDQAAINRIIATIHGLGGVDPAPGAIACFDRVLIAAQREANDPVGGLAAIEAALGRSGTRLWEAEIRRARAEFLVATGAGRGVVDAEISEAAAVAARQGARGPQDRIAQTRIKLDSGS